MKLLVSYRNTFGYLKKWSQGETPGKTKVQCSAGTDHIDAVVRLDA